MTTVTYNGDMPTCIDGHEVTRIKGYGMCENHLKRYHRGTYEPPVAPVPRKMSTDAERMERYITPTGFCWLWTGAHDSNGYGVIRIDGVLQRAHRWVYSVLVGECPEGLDMDHLCRVRECVNPDHLEPVSRQINLLRGARTLRKSLLETCSRGHDLTATRSLLPSGYCRLCANENNRAAYRRAHA